VKKTFFNEPLQRQRTQRSEKREKPRVGLNWLSSCNVYLHLPTSCEGINLESGIGFAEVGVFGRTLSSMAI
jgi:hypothetical protein